eukprot:snap_masked-scaffold_14-processed-gene-5.37-mRNA-1 protein AED:0.38 eAED:1.00 QI:0/-1/0/1/-1/1/1/0/253
MDSRKFYLDTIAYSKHVVDVEQKRQEMVTILACDYFDRLCGCLGGNLEKDLEEKKKFEDLWGFTVESIASKGFNVLLCIYRQEMLRHNKWQKIMQELEKQIPSRTDFYVPKSEEDFKQEKKDEIWFQIKRFNIMRRSFNRLQRHVVEIHPHLLPKRMKPISKVNYEDCKLNEQLISFDIPLIETSQLMMQEVGKHSQITVKSTEQLLPLEKPNLPLVGVIARSPNLKIGDVIKIKCTKRTRERKEDQENVLPS